MSHVATPDTNSSITVYKTMPYRGSTKRWANRYHVTGPTSIGSGPFNTLASSIVAAEAAIYSGGITIVEATWSDASTATSTNPHGIVTQTQTFSTAGTFVGTGGHLAPGDCAAVMRYSTTQRSVKNHPIYLWSYWHDVFNDLSGTADAILPIQITAYNTYGTAWLSGFSDGTNTRIRSGPRGAVAQSRTLLTSIRHRDFPT